MSSDEEDDYPTTSNAVPTPAGMNSPAQPAIRDLEAEQGYSDDDEDDEPVNDAGREDRVADRTRGVAPEDVDDDEAEQDSPPPARQRPADDDDEDDEDEDDDRPAPAQPARKQRAPDPDDDDEDDDDEEEDEDDDEDEDEEEDSRGKKRKHKKRRMNRFIDIEAEVDDEEEDEEEEEDFGGAAADFIEAEGDVPERDFDGRAHRAFDRLEAEKGGMDAVEIARELRERYRNQHREYDGSANFSDRKANMPTAKDPKLWQVRCKPGQERTIITTICLKGFAAMGEEEEYGIFSAFQRDSLPGYVFVEAYGRDFVARALQGISNVYLQAGKSNEEQKNTIQLIENRDMVPLLTMKKKEVTPKRGMWIRIKRGKYTGDLAQVTEINNDGQGVAVLLVPRLDYHPERSKQDKKKRAAGKPANALTSRPPPGLLRPDTLNEIYGRSSCVRRGNLWLFQNEQYTDSGLLDKEYPISSIVTENINPTLNEISKFQGDKEDGVKINLDAIADAAKKSAGSNIRPGDQVIASEGELKGLKGAVETVTADTVTVLFSHLQNHLDNDQDQLIELPAKSVQKIFRIGDHVKVMQGVNINDTGMVLEVENNIVTFFSDLSQKEVKAFSKDLREAATIGALNNRVGDFELHDLVTIDPQTVGVIFQTERDGFKILDQNGSIRSMRPHQITKRPEMEGKRTVGMDHKDREFRIGDQMKEVSGEYRKGLVLHIYRGLFAFMHSREVNENNGVFVVRSKNLGPIDERTTTKSGPDLTKQDPRLNQAMTFFAGNNQGTSQRYLVNTHVVVVKGTQKGLQGIIKDTQGDKARVELKTNNKVVTVPIKSLKKKDPLTGLTSELERERRKDDMAMADPSSNPYMMTSANPYMPSNPYGGSTPFYTAKTPFNSGGATVNPYAMGNATPFLGAATPYGGGGGKTPFDGGKTPFQGGRTPAGMGGATPFGRSNPYGGGATPFGNGAYGGASAYSAPQVPGIDPRWALGLDHVLVKIGNSLTNNPYAEQTYRKGAYQDQYCVLDSNTPAGAQCRVTSTREMLIVPYEFLHPTPPEMPNQAVVIISQSEKGRRTVTVSGDRMMGTWEVQSAPGRPYGPSQLCREA